MTIYLPVAEMPVNILLLVSLGICIGFISGLFGIGGGFLLTPLLIFIGLPTSVAVATVPSHIIASSSSSFLYHWKKKDIDLLLATVLTGAGVCGSGLGILIFSVLELQGNLSLVIAVGYVLVMLGVGLTMFCESLTHARSNNYSPSKPLVQKYSWLNNLPFQVYFRRSGIVVSIIPIVAIGLVIGLISSLLGMGGGFMVVPAVVYILGVTSSTIFGTSVVYIMVTMMATTVAHIFTTGSVDLILALTLMVGGVLGVQLGMQLSRKFKAEQLRLMLSLIIMCLGLKVLTSLLIEPNDLFVVAVY